MKKLTVTELNALTDHIINSVFDRKREEACEKVSNISKDELDELFSRASKLCAEAKAAKKAYEDMMEKLTDLSKECHEKNYMGKRVSMKVYSFEASLENLSNYDLFDKTKFVQIDFLTVRNKLIIENIRSEMDIESLIEEFVKSF